MESKATAEGSDPSDCLIKSAPTRWAQISSCSTAAARKVSAAPIRIFLRSDGIKGHGRRIRSFRLFDKVSPYPMGPDLELLNRSSPEGVSSPDQNFSQIGWNQRPRQKDPILPTV